MAVERSVSQLIELEPGKENRNKELYIWYRGAELTLSSETDIDAIAAVLRSLRSYDGSELGTT